MLVDGTICQVETTGTELESFGDKASRPVLLAFHDDTAAFVYPLTTRRTKLGVRLERASGKVAWIAVEKGLYRVEVSRVTTTEERWIDFGKFRDRIRQDLARREEKPLKEGSESLSHRPMADLVSLKSPSSSKLAKAERRPEAPAEKDLFEEYMRTQAESDARVRGREGRES